MKIVDNSVHFPVTVAVGVILVVLFGAISLSRIPIQLTPTVDTPQVRIQTRWPGALPQEVERQIIQEQEQQLKGIQGLEQIESTSQSGQGEIMLTFQVGINIDTALLDVSNRLQQVQRYPEDALKPQVRAASSETEAIARFSLRYLNKDPDAEPIAQKLDFVEDVIAPELERVPGVSSAQVFGGVRHEMHFYADPVELAARKITIAQLASALDSENTSISGGDFDEGKGNYIVRTAGEYRTPEDIGKVVIGFRGGIPIFAKDVGYARLSFEKKRVQAFMEGEEVIALFISKTPEANLIEVMEGVNDALARMNASLLNPQGLELITLFDSTEYIRSAMELLSGSVYIGAALAVLVLLLFLRSFSSTLVVAVAMPISIVGTFIVMDLTGRSLNVISLAGLAFAVGMVVDNSIVVLENIYRHRQMGKSRPRAALEGASEVWGAILASTLTTVAVFLPVLFIEEEAGQLFRDIAIAISAAVMLSMVVAITVIPALSAKILGGASGHATSGGGTVRSSFFAEKTADMIYWICGGTMRRLLVSGSLTAAAIFGAVQLVPDVEYLPVGNANFIIGNLALPSNYSVTEAESLRHVYSEALGPLKDCDGADANCAGGGIARYFYVAFGNRAFLGGRAKDPLRVRELVPVFREATATIPAVIGGFRQANLFQRGRDAGVIDLNVVGPDFERLQEIGQLVLDRMQQRIPEAQARPASGLDAGKPELRVTPNRLRSSELGVTSRDLGLAVNALVDGVKVSDYQWQGKRIDLMLMAEGGRQHRTHDLNQLPIAVSDGQLVTLDALASIDLTHSPVEIAHRERQRATTVQVTPPLDMPLQTLMKRIDEEVIRPLTQEGVLTGLYRVIPRGSADKLSETWDALSFNLILAVIITYLLMAALFQSFGYPLVILFSVPLAAFGGFLGLSLINRLSYQPLDILTMLGFFILVGTVVNNAILLVHQSLNHIRNDAMDVRDAVREATKNRTRPIFMSVFTSVFGMLPLVLFPGAGSELYRGIGSVVVGGLLVSTVFTLVLVPALFSLFLDTRQGLARMFRALSGSGPQVEPGAGD
jgi:HAE1 family hydrophobic/amphiphilic exporter-1